MEKYYKKLIFNKIIEFFTDNDIISVSQLGFESGDSSVNHFLFITNNIYKSFDAKIETRGVILNISKAFDKVWHEGLLRKLKQKGISDDALNLMRDFLYERQRTIFSVFYLYHD